MFCPRCGSPCPTDAAFCAQCGNSLQTSPSAAATPAQLFAEIVGPHRRDYYLKRFARYHQQGAAGLTWHWPAFFCTLPWLLYRKLWGEAAIYFSLALLYGFSVASGLARAALGEGSAIASGMIGVLGFVLFWLLPALLANAIYYRHCERQIRAVLGRHEHPQRQLGELCGRGGTTHPVALVLMAALLFGNGLIGAVVLPSAHDLQQKRRIAEILGFGQQMQQAIDAYYKEHGALPPSLEHAGFTASPPLGAGSVVYTPLDGSLRITLAQPAPAGVLDLTPQVAAGGLQWHCRSTQLSAQLLPENCRARLR